YCCGIFGANPLEIGIKNAAKKLNKIYDRPFVYGAADTFCKLGEASKVKENIVMSVSGLASARLMEKMMGIPFKTENPFAVDFIKRNEEVLKSKAGSPFKVLITDDQISGNVMRKELKKMGAEVVVSSWFSMDAELKEEGDVKLLEEDDYIRVVSEGDFDFVIADPVQKRMIEKKFDGVFIEKNQFQISGVLYDTCD
nr:hypothetical protein [Lachnospiraceae bacterium]